MGLKKYNVMCWWKWIKNLDYNSQNFRNIPRTYIDIKIVKDAYKSIERENNWKEKILHNRNECTGYGNFIKIILTPSQIILSVEHKCDFLLEYEEYGTKSVL